MKCIILMVTITEREDSDSEDHCIDVGPVKSFLISDQTTSDSEMDIIQKMVFSS